MQSHGECPFKCHVCNNSFARADHTVVREKLDDLWGILTNVNSYLALRDPTKQEVEFGERQCELSL